VSELAQAEHEPSSLGSVTAEGGGSVLLVAAKGCAVTSLARTDDDERRSHRGLNQTTRDWHSRTVTLSEAKGLGVRFFAVLRMICSSGRVVKCTIVMWFDLANRSR
jgi:hypothetical protein